MIGILERIFFSKWPVPCMTHESREENGTATNSCTTLVLENELILTATSHWERRIYRQEAINIELAWPEEAYR